MRTILHPGVFVFSFHPPPETDFMINKIARSIADALAGVADGATVMIGGFGTAGIPNELIDGLIEQGAQGPHHRQQQRRQRRHRPGRAAEGRPRAQDHLQLSAPGRQPRLRRALPQRQDRARAGAAGQPGRAHPRGRRRHRRLLHARPATAPSSPRRKETREIDGRALRARIPDPWRRRADQGRARRPLGQPRPTAWPRATSGR